MYNIPILLITFNRPVHTRRVLEAIVAQNPSDLFVFQDGPRDGNAADVKRVEEVRVVVESMTNNTGITLHTFFSEENLGCGPGPAAGISWFFENVDRGIIIEDDCIPSIDFWGYCEELLLKYENDPRIAFIGGCNYGLDLKNSYSFCSGHQQTWGWATWRRSWEYFDYELKEIGKKEFNRVLKNYYKSPQQREYWQTIFEIVKKDRMKESCWDYQFYFCNWIRNTFAICPRVNLVINVGSGEDATHTFGESPLLSRNCSSILPLKHPAFIQRDEQVDDYLMRNLIIPYEYGLKGLKRFPYRMNRRLKRLVGHEGPWIKTRR